MATQLYNPALGEGAYNPATGATQLTVQPLQYMDPAAEVTEDVQNELSAAPYGVGPYTLAGGIASVTQAEAPGNSASPAGGSVPNASTGAPGMLGLGGLGTGSADTFWTALWNALTNLGSRAAIMFVGAIVILMALVLIGMSGYQDAGKRSGMVKLNAGKG